VRRSLNGHSKTSWAASARVAAATERDRPREEPENRNNQHDLHPSPEPCQRLHPSPRRACSPDYPQDDAQRDWPFRMADHSRNIGGLGGDSKARTSVGREGETTLRARLRSGARGRERSRPPTRDAAPIRIRQGSDSRVAVSARSSLRLRWIDSATNMNTPKTTPTNRP
jgi:hypothetical protein